MNPFRYRGYYYDTETGFYYLQSRYYNPAWGRFLNADAALYPDLYGYNLYAYCYNNPISYVDPTGENAVDVAVIGGMSWLIFLDGPLPIMDVVFGIVFGAALVKTFINVSEGDFILISFPDSSESPTKSESVLPRDFYTIIPETTGEPPKLFLEYSTVDPDPYRRPGRKKQGREPSYGARKKDDWEPRNNRRDGKPRKPKSHTPGRDHRPKSKKNKFSVMERSIVIFYS